MNLSHLLFYLSNQKLANYRDRGAIFAENILNRRLTALRTARAIPMPFATFSIIMQA